MRKSHQIPQLSLSELFSPFEVMHEKRQEKKNNLCLQVETISVNTLCTLNLEFAFFNLPVPLLQVKAKLLFLPNLSLLLYMC